MARAIEAGLHRLAVALGFVLVAGQRGHAGPGFKRESEQQRIVVSLGTLQVHGLLRRGG